MLLGHTLAALALAACLLITLDAQQAGELALGATVGLSAHGREARDLRKILSGGKPRKKKKRTAA